MRNQCEEHSKGLSYRFFIDSDQSIYQWLQEHCGCTAAVMDYWKGKCAKRPLPGTVRVLHFKGSAQENGSCQHRQTYSEKMQPHSAARRNETLERGITSRSRLNITERWKRHLHACTHSRLFISVFCSSCAMRSIKKDNSSLQLSPQACFPSDGGLFKSAGILRGCWIIHLQSVTQPTALFHITYAEFPGARTASVRLRHPSFQELK